MSDLKPSDIEGIVKDMETLAMSRVAIPADATTMQKYTALFAPIAGDADLNHSQSNWYLGHCIAQVAIEFRQGVDPSQAAGEIRAAVKQFSGMVKQPGAKVRQLYDVFEAYQDPSSRVPDLNWDFHRLVYMREQDSTKRLPLLQSAVIQNLTLGDLQKQLNKAQKNDQGERDVLVQRVARAEAGLTRAQAALKRYDQQHGTPPAPVTPGPEKSPRNPSKAA